MSKHVVKAGNKYFHALLGVKDEDGAARMAQILMTFEPTAETIGLLVPTTVAFGNFTAARGLIKQGYEMLPEAEHGSLDKTNLTLPTQERYEVK